MSALRPYLLFAMIVALAYTGWIFASRSISSRRWQAQHAQGQAQRDSNPEFDKIYGGTEVKILQFYAREGTLTEGTHSVICYGVLNAKSVRIEPPVDGVFVALNRCVSVAPEHDTRYTLTAEGNDGKTVSQSFVLGVRPDTDTLPKISSFRIASHQTDYRGRTIFLLSFAAQNAQTIDIEPHAFPTLHGSPNGQFYVSPEKTTEYTLIATGKHGHQAKQQLTVVVPQK